LYCAAPENIRTPPTEGIGISWGRGFKECMALNWNFQRGREVLGKNLFHAGGMDIFWNYTFSYSFLYSYLPVVVFLIG